MKKMTPSELRKRLDANEVTLVDVREPVEHRSECIEGACSIPLAQISKEKLPSATLPIVVHCQSGPRSEQAYEKLLQQNPGLDIYMLVGGIAAWKNAGFPVKKSSSAGLSVGRQIQLTIGFFVVLGVILGAFLAPIFYALCAFFGLGLMFAGLTGWCGLEKMLLKMPWNQ